jgi:hypothetical protein
MDGDSTTYTTAAGVWRRSGGVIAVLSALNVLIAKFPVDFVRDGGDDTWRYIMYVVHLLVDVKLEDNWKIVDAAGDCMDLAHSPAPGIYRFISGMLLETLASL